MTEKKIIIYSSIIAGLFISTAMLSMVNYYSHCEGSIDFNQSMLLGYASMLIGFTAVYVALKKIRDNFSDGKISFGKAFKIGLLIVLNASTIYVISWLIDYFFFIPDFMDKYAANVYNELKASGKNEMEIAREMMEMSKYADMYKNPFYNALFTYMEILPLGFLMALISSLILKRK